MSTLNQKVSEKLREIAALLAAQHANPFRTRAYFNAANTIDRLNEDLDDLIQSKGIKGLIDLPGVGKGIAASIYEYVALGRMTRLENLQGASDPVGLFESIPAVGKVLADRIHETLHVDSLEALENAAANGRLDRVEGLGAKRQQAIKAWLSTQLGKQRQRPAQTGHFDNSPDIALLLKIDIEYRDKAKAGKLPLITPKRFNTENKAWLPILHTTKKNWHFTALYSNTERAHKLDRVFDWVVIYFYDDHHQEGQHTVVTETHGRLTGKRVVRGREPECFEYYEAKVAI